MTIRSCWGVTGGNWRSDSRPRAGDTAIVILRGVQPPKGGRRWPKPRLIFSAAALRVSDGCPSRMDIRDYRGRALAGYFDDLTLGPGQARRVAKAKARVSVMSERQQPGGSAGGAGTELRGTIKWFNPEKGYGFV